MEKVDRLEGTVFAMEGELVVVRNVNTLLSRRLDETDSYSQRSCMIITGLRKPVNDETNVEDELNAISAVAKEAGIYFLKIHRSVLHKTTIDLWYF